MFKFRRLQNLAIRQNLWVLIFMDPKLVKLGMASQIAHDKLYLCQWPIVIIYLLLRGDVTCIKIYRNLPLEKAFHVDEN